MHNCRKIWLIDDDVVYQTLVRFLFETELQHFSLETYENGLVGFEALLNTARKDSELPAIILLDLNMPVMNGWDFLDAFTDWQQNKQTGIKLFVISSSVSLVDKKRALAYDVVEDYISKPISHDQLRMIDHAYVRA